MAATFESCFDFAFFYAKLTPLPPFVSSSQNFLGYFNFILSFVFFIRSVLAITNDGLRNYENYFYACETMYISLRSFIFLYQHNKFIKFIKLINKFLEINNSNPINKKNGGFVKIWNENKPIKFFKWCWWCESIFALIYIFYVCCIIILNNPTKNPCPIYSPYFDSKIYKYLYLIMDPVMAFSIAVQVIQSELVIIILLSFVRCLMVYLDDLLKEMFDDDFKNRNDLMNKWWIENHIRALE